MICSPILPADVAHSLTPAQLRVWCALVVRHKAILWGGAGLKFMNHADLSAAASVSTETLTSALRRLERFGVVQVHQRWVPPSWDGDLSKIHDRQDAWHPVRLANDYELRLPRIAEEPSPSEGVDA